MVEDAEMERAIAAAGEAALLEQQLPEQPLEVDAARGEHAEVAVQRQDPIVRRRSAAVTPTAIASWPMPENHFDSLP